MAMAVTETLLRAIATKDKQISDGRTLAQKGSFVQAHAAEDGALIWGQCQGSALYSVSVDLAASPPITRCSCPVKPPPCKHALGLLVLRMTRPESFQEGTPPADLTEKRAKSAERAEKRAESATRPRVVDKAALEKKTQEQRQSLDLLENLLVDLASGGLATLDAARAKRLGEQARQLTDGYLKGAAFELQRLAALPEAALADDDRTALMVRHLTRLWAMVRRGRKYLDAKLEEGESQAQADAVIEELLGHDWKLVELKERGLVRAQVELVEVAFERRDDAVRHERIEESWLVDLADGSVHVDRHMRPLSALDRVRGGQSFEQHLTVKEAAIYPGFVNRRIRWEVAAHVERPLAGADWERVHAVAPALEAGFSRYRDQLKNPLAPSDAVVMVRAANVERTPAGLALVDPAGARLLLADPPLAPRRTTSNLAMAAGARLEGGSLRGPATVAVRLWQGLSDGLVRGQPLALVSGDVHVRLGM